MAANAVVLVLGGYQISIATYLRGGIYPHIKLEIDTLNIFRVRALTSSGSTGGGGDAKTIISPNTSEKLESVIILLRITHLAHRNSYLVIFCPNSHDKLTKIKIICPN